LAPASDSRGNGCIDRRDALDWHRPGPGERQVPVIDDSIGSPLGSQRRDVVSKISKARALLAATISIVSLLFVAVAPALAGGRWG
jgi:hypothetical protein